jgi:predicted membrane protein
VIGLSKEALAYIKGLFSALLILSLAAILIVPLTSQILNNKESISEINIYITLLIVWVLLAITLGIVYLALEGSKGFKHIPLPINKEEK